jgi:hypothetical protein
MNNVYNIGYTYLRYRGTRLEVCKFEGSVSQFVLVIRVFRAPSSKDLDGPKMVYCLESVRAYHKWDGRDKVLILILGCA